MKSWLRLPPWDPEKEPLFEFRRAAGLPAGVHVALVVGLWVATVWFTHAEYQESGTVFGYPGPGFHVLFAPIYEELVFRGWILGQLARRRPAWFAILVSSLLFGLLHLRNIYWLDTDRLLGNMAFTGLVLGPILAWVTLRCRSVWPAVSLHFANNLLYFV